MTLEDLGEGDDDALLCLTDQPPYTSGNRTALGNWFFPNGTRVPSIDKQWDFQRTRDRMVVRLNRRGMGQDGVYRCEIPDTLNVTQTIYIGVYTESAGE